MTEFLVILVILAVFLLFLRGRQRGVVIEFKNGALTVGDDSFADTTRSANKRFVAGARESFNSRKKEFSGSCILVDLNRNTVCFHVFVSRANNPNVSDEGLTLVEDWEGDELSGSLLAFSRDGKLIWKRPFDANIIQSGLSLDGRRAFVSTARSDSKTDSNRTLFLVAQTGEVIWERHVVSFLRFNKNQLEADVSRGSQRKKYLKFDETGKLSNEE